MIIGHQKQWQFLRKSAEIGKIPHGFLFFGQEQLGKKKIALEFIKLLNCQDNLVQKRPCQICLSCREIEKGQHPDLLLVKPPHQNFGGGGKPLGKDYNPPTSSSHPSLRSGWAPIQIFQIRELINRLSLRPFQALFKAAVIDQAHLMNQEAQTALLKTLEEPKGNSILILITEYPERLFPTILSRVQKIKFYPVKRKEIEDYLWQRGCSQDKIKFISPISFGKPGIAVNFLLNSEKLATEHQKLRELIKITTSDLASRFQYAKKITQQTRGQNNFVLDTPIIGPPQNLKEILESWLRYFRELLLLEAGIVSDSAYYPELQTIFKRYSLSKLREIIKILQNIIFFLSTTNVNPRLSLEILMLEL